MFLPAVQFIILCEIAKYHNIPELILFEGFSI